VIEHTESFGQAKRVVMAPKCSVGDGVKRPARNSPHFDGAPDGAHPIYDFARRSAGERQQQDSFRRHAIVEQKFDSCRERCRFSGAGPRHNAKGSVTKGGRFALTLV
jgi:hypothetical protein